MTSSRFLSAIALAALAFLTACGGGEASDDSAGVAGGNGAAAQRVGGIGGSGADAQRVGGIGGSGVVAQRVGGIGGSGIGIASVSARQGCGLASVVVTVAAVRVNANGAADPAGDGWVDVTLPAPVRVDLLSLAAGGAFPIDLSSLPDGSYAQMRLLLVAGDATAPLADAVVTADGTEAALVVPDAAQGGLALAAAVTVAGGQVSASYRDLAVCKAVTDTAGVYALGPVNSGATQVASAY